jgi:SAM-dependent methyltransferase
MIGAIEQQIEVKNCPLCSTPRSQSNPIIMTVKVARLEQSCDIIQCNNCGLFYKTWIPNHDYLSLVYGENYHCYHVSDHAALGYTQLLEEVEKRVNKGRLLDVGAGGGGLVKSALQRGWDAWGIEPYPAAFLNMDSEVRDRIHQCYLDSLFQTDEPFDVVIIWNLLEHVSQPRELLKQCTRVLKEEGLLMLSTPNFKSMARWYAGSEWAQAYRPDHLSFWSSELFLNYFPTLDLQVLKIYSSGAPAGFSKYKPKPAKNLAIRDRDEPASVSPTKQFNQRRQFSRFALQNKILGSPYLRGTLKAIVRLLWLGDNLTVIARKTVNSHQ